MRPVLLHTLMRRTDDTRTVAYRPERLRVDTARQIIRRARRSAAVVRVFETTDRDGNNVHVAHVQFGRDRWRDVDSVTDIYEIPTKALTDL
ncbi:hypothetical protein [Streptomyces sp. FIT100]|uniref:hypothetical protein n=1 Tax=Streptomyces sp. FIT100 TaxID=2837956 RepID=UPI0021CAB3DA|nr:hypothetical protein [Streptomyces sp. FIT100]UUN28577.1 hypothetical protein KK483_20985 [Streptomyces sp. FIT100]